MTSKALVRCAKAGRTPSRETAPSLAVNEFGSGQE